jgi:hypothetical protein
MYLNKRNPMKNHFPIMIKNIFVLLCFFNIILSAFLIRILHFKLSLESSNLNFVFSSDLILAATLFSINSGTKIFINKIINYNIKRFLP